MNLFVLTEIDKHDDKLKTIISFCGLQAEQPRALSILFAVSKDFSIDISLKHGKERENGKFAEVHKKRFKSASLTTYKGGKKITVLNPKFV